MASPSMRTGSSAQRPGPRRDGDIPQVRRSRSLRTPAVFGDPLLTQLDLAQHWHRVWPVVGPCYRARPLTVVRCPSGVQPGTGTRPEAHGCHFSDHDPLRRWPASVRRVQVPTAKGVRAYLVADSLASVLSLLAHGVVELHVLPWTTDAPGCPDRLIFDLDPGEEVPWEAVVQTARALRALLDQLGLQSWVATTGGRGLHVLTPIRPAHPARVTFAAARAIAQRLAAQHPSLLTLALPRAGRADRILVDYLRNKRTDSAIGPGSPRARAGAPIAWPCAWEALTPAAPGPTVATLQARDLRDARRAWAAFLDVHQALPARVADVAEVLTRTAGDHR